jgi:hypothetical protein
MEKNHDINKILNRLPIHNILSYSRIDTLSCPLKYKIKYIDKNYPKGDSLALNLGSLCHKGLELKYQGENINTVWNKIINGCEDNGVKLLGIKDLKTEYPFDFEEVNEKSGLTYKDKLNTYKNKLFNEELEEDWEVIGTEVEFLILFNNKALIKGFIDRVDKNITTGEIRVIDYKTNNKEFEKAKLATPLQMYIYSLACYKMYGQYPSECIYDLIFLDKKQVGGTKGYLKRGFDKLNKLLDEIIYYQEIGTEQMIPKPTPLCFWCDYCRQNPNSLDEKFHLCEYYSLWTPYEKTFKVNKDWIAPSSDDGWGDDIDEWD